MPRALVHDRAAADDLIEIWVYSFRTWGETQADRYLDALERGIRALSAAPEQGKNRDEIRAAYWSVRIEHHVAFYTFTDAEVRIRRVLHEVMDPGLHI